MLASLHGPMRRSALAATKQTAGVWSTLSTAPRRFQSSSSSSSSDFASFQNDFAALVAPERPVHASTLDRLDLAHGAFFALDRPLLGITNMPMESSNAEDIANVENLTNYFSTLRPFSPPNTVESIKADQRVQDFFRAVEEKQHILDTIDGRISTPVSSQIEQVSIDGIEEANGMYMTSVLRKRKIKMRKHKYQKLRKRTRALRKKLGK
ncbi:hypothetical protein EMPS_06704 [Entomortierella parvispora]|uniref:Small ribosomal subunit protein mS38 n=1 Tax=Entomortierella parvispora TaxID=205924 RepID=A0A9P3HCR0_9FUNG|nr:hypothetical protein EMPS_06704 [Entomortierella parvispora]